MAKAELFQKDIPENKRIFYYENEEDDPIKTEEQEKETVAKKVDKTSTFKLNVQRASCETQR